MDEEHGQRTLSGRDVRYGVLGILLGVVVLSSVWSITGRNAAPAMTLAQVPATAAPAFTLTDLTGKARQLTDYHGRVVVLNFWGTYCEPCKAETPALQAAYAKYTDRGLTIIGVDVTNMERVWGKTEQHVREFAAEYNVTYPLLLDTRGQVSQSYNIVQTPTSYVIDTTGQLRYVKVGTLTATDIEHVFELVHEEASRTSR